MIEKYKELKSKLSDKVTGEIDELGFYSIEDICKITNPKTILEIGFNRGNSALMWLLSSNAKLTSMDLRKRETVNESINVLEKHFPERFEYVEKDGYTELHLTNEWINKFDLIFIDTWHQPLGYEIDTLTAKYLGCKYIAYDDYTTHKNSYYIRNYISNDSDLKEIKKYNTNQGLIQVVNDKSNDQVILNNIKNKVKNNMNIFNELKKHFNK